jgi:hypothetical protein
MFRRWIVSGHKILKQAVMKMKESSSDSDLPLPKGRGFYPAFFIHLLFLIEFSKMPENA